MAGTLVIDTLNASTGPLSTNNGMSGIAKAWVNFDGTLTSPITPRNSFNVGSVIKNATGDYTINFSTSMANTTYSVVGMGQYDQTPSASSPALVSIYRSSTALQAASCRILCTSSSATSTVDFPTVCVTVFD